MKCNYKWNSTLSFYVYVDGESLFIRTKERWQKLHGEQATMDTLKEGNDLPPIYNHAHRTNLTRMFLDEDGKFFWDTGLLGLFESHSHSRYALIDRAVYFTSYSGDQQKLHQLKLYIRSAGFEPQVVSELKRLSDRRENSLKQSGFIEKAKGVDISLTVRILEDAYNNNFDTCFFFTSDVDYIPVIEAVRRHGKKVNVLGYKDGLSNQSTLEWIPDRFYDLGEHLASEYYRYEPKSN